MIGREQRRCCGCMGLVSSDQAQLLSDELANMPNPLHDPEGHWREAVVQIQPGNDPQFRLDSGDPALCRPCVKRARQPAVRNAGLCQDHQDSRQSEDTFSTT